MLMHQAWTDLLAAHPDATVYHTPNWIAIQRACFGYTDRTTILPAALFTCMEVGRRGPFKDLRSVPGGYGGLISSAPMQPDREPWRALTQACQLGARLTIRSNPLACRASDPPANVPLVHISRLADFTHVLDVEPGFDKLWSNIFDKKARNQYRKGVKEGVSVQRDASPQAIAGYHRLHVQTSRGWAAQERRSHDFFERLFRAGGGCVALWMALNTESEQIGGVITLEFGQTVHIWGTARDQRFASARPMDVLYTEVIKDACDRGFRRVDLGSSLGLPSVQAFKEQFGARRIDYPVWVLEGLPWWAGRRLRRRPA